MTIDEGGHPCKQKEGQSIVLLVVDKTLRNRNLSLSLSLFIVLWLALISDDKKKVA